MVHGAQRPWRYKDSEAFGVRCQQGVEVFFPVLERQGELGC